MNQTKKKEEKIIMPICPYCKTEMQPTHYIGYYDEFYFWECDCYELPKAETLKGANEF